MKNLIKNITTPRLLLTPMIPEHGAHMYALNQDEDVIKYTGDVAFQSIEEAEKFIHQYDQYQKYGVGRLSVFLRGSNEYIGFCGLRYSPHEDEYDIGFRLMKKFWGYGYATEAAKKCISVWHQDKGINRVVGRSLSSNKASIHVLQKLGFSYIHSRNTDGVEEKIFELLLQNIIL